MTPEHPHNTAQAGQKRGRWTLVERLGAGAFGETWIASGDGGRTVALKLVAAPVGTEIKALSRMCHPAVPRLLDHGEWSGELNFVAMDLAPG